MPSTTTLHVGALLCSGLITSSLGVYAWRRRSRPGALAFAGLMTCTTVWSAAYAIALPTLSPVWRVVWENLQWFGIAFLPVFLALFVFEYAGYDHLLTERIAAGLSVVPAITVVLVWTNASTAHSLIWTDQTLVVVDGIAIAVQEFGPWYHVNLLYSYLLIGASVFLLLEASRTGGRQFRWQAALLLVGLSAPVIANLLSVLGYAPIEGLDMTPYVFSVTGLAFWRATFGHGLLERGPATFQVGQSAALEGLSEGVALTDVDGRVVWLNPTAQSMFDYSLAAAAGVPIAAVIGTDPFEADAPAEIRRGDRTFEVTATPLANEQDSAVGHTVLFYEVTSRKRRIGMLREQRSELETLSRINDVIRDVNRALVGATTREEIDAAVRRTLSASALYADARIEDSPVSADGGSASTPAGADPAEMARPATDGNSPADGNSPTDDDSPADGDSGSDGVARIQIAYGGTRYDELVLTTDREDAFGERERAVLEELGELIGLAINGVRTRKLLVADAVIELAFSCTDDDEVLVAASDALDCRLTLETVVPTGENTVLAYLRVEDAAVEAVVERFADDATDEADADRFADDAATDARRIDDGTVELTISGRSALLPLVEFGANLTHLAAASGQLRIEVEVGRDEDARTLHERLQASFPSTELLAKQERDRTPGGAEPADDRDLTPRQRESLDVAYRAGYFDWPRASTAEEVAESMGVSPPTLHNHLRKGEKKLVGSFFEDEPE